MKSLNPLYYFLKYRQPSHPGFKDDKNGNAYFMLDLTVSRDVSCDYQVMAYALQEHHLSFYEKQDDNKAWLSQYHYTAKIRNAEGQGCKLHVYFSDSDAIVDVMLLTPLGDDDYQKLEIDTTMRAWFETLAIQSSLSPLIQLRQELQDHRKQLEEQYDVLEQEASLLSHDLQLHHQAYQEKSQALLGVLSLLSPYDTMYQSIHNCLVNVKTHVASLTIPVQTHSAIAVLLSEEVRSVNSESKHESGALIKVDSSLSDLLEQMQTAKTQCDTATKLKLAEQVPFVVMYLNYCNEANVLVAETNTALPEQLQKIRALYLDSLRQAKKLLNTLLLINGDVGSAALALKNITPLLSPKNSVHAVIKGKAALLDFLLTHGRIAVNSLQIEKQQVLWYCLQQQHDPNMIKILSVLIKHGVTLMIKAPDGLPIAYHILTGPLQAALTEHSQITLSHAAFYSRLVFSLEQYLKNVVVDNERRNILQAAITSFQEAKSTLLNMNVGEKSRDRYVQASMSMTACILQQMQSTQSHLVHDLNQRDYQHKLRELKEVSQNLMKLMTKQQMNASVKVMGEIKRLFSEDEKATAQEEKIDNKTKLTQLDDYIKLVRFLLEKTELENGLAKTKHSAKSKKINDATITELNKIDTAISEILLKWELLASDMPQHMKSLIDVKVDEATIEQLACLFPMLINKIQDHDKTKALHDREGRKLIEQDEIQEITDLMNTHLGIDGARQFFLVAKTLAYSPSCKAMLKKLAEFSRTNIVGLFYQYVIGKGKGVAQVKQGDDFFQLELSNPGYSFVTGRANLNPGIDVGQRFEFKVVKLIPVAESTSTLAPSSALRR